MGYALGRDCQLRIESVLISSAQDVFVREIANEIDATKFGGMVQCSVATHRNIEIQATIADVAVARTIAGLRAQRTGFFYLPGVVYVSLFGGVFNIESWFTISDIEGDEPLNGLVLPRFTFRQFE